MTCPLNEDADDQNAPECTKDADCGGASSGKVCDADTLKCGPGCREGGNGCPSGKVCTSTTTTVGVCEDSSASGGGNGQGGGGATSGGDSGCSCSLVESHDDATGLWLLAAAGVIVGMRRRQRARAC